MVNAVRGIPQVRAASGKMSSRKGNVIYFSALVDQLGREIYDEFLSKYEGDWPKDEIERAVHRLSVATIKYGMLKQ